MNTFVVKDKYNTSFIFPFTKGKECSGLMVVEGIKCMEAFTSINVKYVNNSILAYKKSWRYSHSFFFCP